MGCGNRAGPASLSEKLSDRLLDWCIAHASPRRTTATTTMRIKSTTCSSPVSSRTGDTSERRPARRAARRRFLTSPLWNARQSPNSVLLVTVLPSFAPRVAPTCRSPPHGTVCPVWRGGQASRSRQLRASGRPATRSSPTITRQLARLPLVRTTPGRVGLWHETPTATAQCAADGGRVPLTSRKHIISHIKLRLTLPGGSARLLAHGGTRGDRGIGDRRT